MANRRPPPQYISFLVAALTFTAFLEALVLVPAAMAAGPTAEVEGWYQLEKDKALEKSFHMAIHAMHKYMEDLASSFRDGNGESGGTAQADAIRSIGTGSRTFSVVAVDITAPLTWTTRCDTGAGRPVPCSNLACATMAPDQPLMCASSPSSPPCAYGTSTVLYDAGHPITLVASSGSTNSQAQVYACGNQAAVGAPSSMAAVIGLGWRGARSLGLQGFSYSVDSNRRISVSVSVGGGAVLARRGSSTGTAALLSNPNYPDLYYVSVTGINVGGDEVPFPAGALDLRYDGSGGVFLSTTMPFTLLETNVYWSLIKKLNAQLPQKSIIRSLLSPDQLCYRSGTQTSPRITLVLGRGGATTKLRVENCWYKQAENSVCLAILPSLWPTGESVLGTMMQSGWRMTYDLSAKTLTFQSLSSSTPSTVRHNSLLLLLLLMSFLTMFLNMQVS